MIDIVTEFINFYNTPSGLITVIATGSVLSCCVISCVCKKCFCF